MRYFAVKDAEILQDRTLKIGLEQKETLHNLTLELGNLTRRVKSLEDKHLRVRRTLKSIRTKAERAARYEIMDDMAQAMPDAEQREAWGYYYGNYSFV